MSKNTDKTAENQFVDTTADLSTTMLSSRTITLDEPLKRGSTEIKEITVRKPGVSELRGISLTALGEMDVTALLGILPRIITPMLQKSEIENMAPADLVQLGVTVAGFLLPTAKRREVFQN